MKTKMNITDAHTLEDLVFENRNKAYGAYALNKNYRKYLLIAFFISLTGVSTVIAVPFLRALKNTVSYLIPEKIISAHIEKVDDHLVKPVMPPAPKPLIDEKQVSYSPPLVVEDAPDDNTFGSMGELMDEIINDIPPEIDIPVESITPEIPVDQSEPVLFPEEHASFRNGNINEFRTWIAQNMVYPKDAISLNIFGKVIVQFCINAKGEVVDVTVLRGIDPLLDQESIRVILSSPLWRAARQGGKPVKERFVIPVLFKLQE
jgi:protein TonB